MKHSILVLDSELRAALAATRSLGLRGYRVLVAGHQKGSLASASRHAARSLRLPSSLAEPETFAAQVAAIVEEEHVDRILPISEPSWLAILAAPEVPRQLLLPPITLQAFNRATDKRALLELATASGIPVPDYVVVTGAPGSTANIPHSFFPVVVKPARSVYQQGAKRGKVAVTHASDRAGLELAITRYQPEAGPFLVQRKIFGAGIGVFLLRWQGRYVASFSHRRLIEKPPEGGVSVLSESTSRNQPLEESACVLLDALDWHGLAMVEFKRDLTTGKDYLMEINPRLWGSVQLAIDCGIDFPGLLADLSFGKPVKPHMSWQAGRRLRWRLGVLDHLLTRLHRGIRRVPTTAEVPRLPSVLTELVQVSGESARDEVLRWNDPLPAFVEAYQWLRQR